MLDKNSNNNLVDNRDEVIENVTTLYSDLNVEHSDNAKGLLRKGHRFVVEVIDSRIYFAPSTYASIKGNSAEKHPDSKGQPSGDKVISLLNKFYDEYKAKKASNNYDKIDNIRKKVFITSYDKPVYLLPKGMTVEEVIKFEPYKFDANDNDSHDSANDMTNTDKVDTKLQPFIELLKSNHNLILTGAPGTGKTYLAKQIAKAMGAETEFVQFHPSYDYTDFVEGLRPKSDANGDIGFERRDGVFKAFCKEALRSLPKKGEDGLKKAYDSLVEDINSGKVKEITLKKGKKNKVIIKEKHEELSNIAFIVNGSKKPHEVKYTDIKKLSQKNKTISDLYEINNIYGEVGAEASYIWAVLRFLYENYYIFETAKERVEDEKTPFVFIIDEINRGDISKILGELFFSIDPGYRGEKGRVQTQYQNLIDKGDDIYDEGFYVPENVYIIGTMNDIDRSVESMDFAMRRRFAWKEITAESQKDMLDKLGDKKKDAINRMNSLNDKIGSMTDNDLSAAYHIGPAYFLKLNMYKNEDDSGWNSLWENHIAGVLREYLRGNEDIDKLMVDLRNAYDLKNGQKDAPTQGNEGEGSEEVTEAEG